VLIAAMKKINRTLTRY